MASHRTSDRTYLKYREKLKKTTDICAICTELSPATVMGPV
jgi:hypothetical protein